MRIISSTRPNSRYVDIKGIPEYHSFKASESLSEMDVLIRLRAPGLNPPGLFDRIPVDLVVVLDTGHIMNGRPLDRAKSTLQHVIRTLGPQDRLCIVSSRMHAAFEVVPFFSLEDCKDREDAKRVVSALDASAMSGVLFGVGMAGDLLERKKRPKVVPAIIFICGGKDEHFEQGSTKNVLTALLPPCIYPRKGEAEEATEIFPVHTIGVGSAHDPLVLYAISEASHGTYSCIDSSDILQETVTLIIGCLTTIVGHSCEINIQSATPEVKLKSISSGRYISDGPNEFQGTITIGNLVADELKEFLVTISVPKHEVDLIKHGCQST